MTYPKYLQSGPAVDYLQSVWGLPVSIKTLAKYRSLGGGPEFHRGHGAALYAPTSLDAWAESKISGPLKRASDAQPVAA